MCRKSRYELNLNYTVGHTDTGTATVAFVNQHIFGLRYGL